MPSMGSGGMSPKFFCIDLNINIQKLCNGIATNQYTCTATIIVCMCVELDPDKVAKNKQ